MSTTQYGINTAAMRFATGVVGDANWVKRLKGAPLKDQLKLHPHTIPLGLAPSTTPVSWLSQSGCGTGRWTLIPYYTKVKERPTDHDCYNEITKGMDDG